MNENLYTIDHNNLFRQLKWVESQQNSTFISTLTFYNCCYVSQQTHKLEITLIQYHINQFIIETTLPNQIIFTPLLSIICKITVSVHNVSKVYCKNKK